MFFMVSGLEDLRHTTFATPPTPPRNRVWGRHTLPNREPFILHLVDQMDEFSLFSIHNRNPPFPRLDYPRQNPICLRTRPRPP